MRKTAEEDFARFQLYERSNLSKILPALLMNIEKGEWESANRDTSRDTPGKLVYLLS